MYHVKQMNKSCCSGSQTGGKLLPRDNMRYFGG